MYMRLSNKLVVRKTCRCDETVSDEWRGLFTDRKIHPSVVMKDVLDIYGSGAAVTLICFPLVFVFLVRHLVLLHLVAWLIVDPHREDDMVT